MTEIPIVIGALGTVKKGLGTETGGPGDKRMSGDHPNYIIEIGHNTKKSPGDLRRLAVTQTPVENNQVMLFWKNSQMSKIIMMKCMDSRLKSLLPSTTDWLSKLTVAQKKQIYLNK